MFRNYLAAAFRNLSRNRFYAAINIIGLSVAFAAAGLIALYIRDELTYEHWLPDYQNVYRISAGVADARGGQDMNAVPSDVGNWLKLDFPQAGEVTRLVGMATTVGEGEHEVRDFVQWADPNVFEVLQYPMVAGDPHTALREPNSIVLTKRAAQRFFGRQDVMGATLLFDRKYPMRVTGILQDLPSNTHLQFNILASARSAFSFTQEQDAMPMAHFGQKVWNFSCYFRPKPGASIEAMRAAMPAFLNRHAPRPPGQPPMTNIYKLTIAPISSIHLGTGVLQPPGSTRNANVDLLLAMGIIGVLIVIIASINFINLMTARASRRAVEVGVRKALGAGRRDLVVQFVGEALIYVAFAAAFALVLVELVLPKFNLFMDRSISTGLLREPAVALSIIGFTLLVGLLAGLYPAFVLSMFRPAGVLSGGPVAGNRGSVVRNVLVVVQFSVLIALIVISVVFHRQSQFALRKTLASGGDQIAMMESACSPALLHEISQVRGVERAACAMQVPLFGMGPGSGLSRVDRLGSTGVSYTSITAGLFEVYGLKPIAGRFFDENKPADRMPSTWDGSRREAIIVNEAAVRALGYNSPKAAVGQLVTWTHLINFTSGFAPPHVAEIIGVVPDFAPSVREGIRPIAVYYDPALVTSMSVRVKPDDIPGTITRMKDVWRKVGDPSPFRPMFVDVRFEQQYRGLTRQTTLATAFAGIALFIACLGLFGLAAFTAERRTKEIGVRKAMGASTADVMRLLVLQFTKPVAWAILVAWPIGYFVSRHWLEGFVYRIDLSLWIFIAAAAAALIVSLVTVSAHSFLVARAAPVNALRYQ
jgi:putative ABC transport system permease protein